MIEWLNYHSLIYLILSNKSNVGCGVAYPSHDFP